MNSPLRTAALALLATFVLGGCDLLGIEPASMVAARKEAEGRAIGGGCRHAGRPIEDCYALNKRVEKAAVFAGWREMNDYMRENRMDTALQPASAPPEVTAKADAEAPAQVRKPARH